MYVRTYVPVRMYMYVCMHVCMYVCVYVRMYVYIYMNVCMYVRMYARMYVCMHFKYAPSPGSDTTYYVTSYLFLVIGRGCRVCLCSRRRSLHSLYNVYLLALCSCTVAATVCQSIEFVNFINNFRCLVIRSCSLIGQIPCFSVSFSSISLCC